MADAGGLQLLPETRKKIEIKIPGENRPVFIGSVALLVIVISTIGLYLYNSSQENKLANLENDITNLEQKRNKQAEQNILVFDKQSAMLSDLLSKHPYWTTGFSKVEGLLQNQVQFDSLTASTTDDKIDFKAVAANYSTIARQIASFLSDESVEDITLNKVSTLTNGRLEFSMQILFNKNKFLKNK
ncbi:MAG: hypothetical protein HYZ69_03995 [Candidatus Colwellbacteria bacterium]|nr:hypothetical protein [Candidatus Colwellbacteria bacterium]